MIFLTRTLSVLALVCAGSAPAAVIRTPHLDAELIAEHEALRAGAANALALRLQPEPGWHTYWRNPGDAGYATTLGWTLPRGYSAGDIVWPFPEKHRLGELVTYGYGGETLLRTELHVPADARGMAGLAALAKWLVCSDEVCVPGEARLSLNLPVSASPRADARWSAAFAESRRREPRESASLAARFSVEGRTFSLWLDGLDAARDRRAEFFALANDLLDHSAPQSVTREGGRLRISQPTSSYLDSAPARADGVLVIEGDGAYAVHATTGADAPAHGSLLLALGLALLGGLILNLMPCVFPVLSLKALALAEAREASRADNRVQALAYTAGVVLSCAAAATMLMVLRAGGEAVGWGFQLQSPVFVGLLVYLLFALGLSLSGVAEFGAGLMNLGGALAQRRGLAGSFFTGVLALVVASPCTAPFMGTALGYALTQPPAAALVIFSTLGLGLALPFLALGFFPQLAAVLPRPGAWMLGFRRLMAYPLYLSAVWLLWVLMRQAGADAAALTLCGLLLVAFALGSTRRALKLTALALAIALLWVPTRTPPPDAVTRTETWSPARVQQLRAQGRTVFVDFTADWCLTCKVNERVALNTSSVQAAFREKNVAYLVADWTRPDETIARTLAEFRQPGVPMYLVYVKGGEPKQLPQVLTPDLVIQSLEN